MQGIPVDAAGVQARAAMNGVIVMATWPQRGGSGGTGAGTRRARRSSGAAMVAHRPRVARNL
ncbi:hypothetical protein PT2222_10099 [Paraburkholderia tropica]